MKTQDTLDRDMPIRGKPVINQNNPGELTKEKCFTRVDLGRIIKNRR